MAAVSYGESLPDSELLVNSRTEAIIGLLPTFSTFLSQRAALEREFSRKLTDLTGRARSSANKDALTRGGRDSTLEIAFARVLEQTDLDARERSREADEFEKEVSERMSGAGGKFEGVRKKHHAFAGRLLSERDRAYTDREKSRTRYFEACDSLETARQKKTQAKDERQSEKANKIYQTALEDMNITKNQFLLDTDSANHAKHRLYTIDLPSAHDDLQLLEASAVHQFVYLMGKYVEIQRGSLERLLDSVRLTEGAVKTIDVGRDQEGFVVEHSASKLAGWELPRDLEFEECPAWHDTDEMSITPPSIIYLQNVKMKALGQLGEINSTIEVKRREIAGLRNLRDAYERDRSLGSAESVLENLFDSTREVTLLEITQTELQAQVALIDASLGDNGSTNLRLHDFKSSSFVTPAPCAVCGSSVWGKGLACRACGLPVHAKCELKVPAGCLNKAGAGVNRSHSRKTSTTTTSTTGGTTTLSPSTSISSTTSSIPPPRSLPPPTRTSLPPPPTEETTATLLYPYTAATAFELTVSESEIVFIVEPEDSSGWTKIRTGDGRVGLVPGSYLQEGGAAASGGGGREQEQEQGGERVRVLYDYEAQSGDELSVKEGEEVVLTKLGRGAGDGWTEATKNGQTGLVPSSYIETI